MQEKGQYRIIGPEGEQWAKVSGKSYKKLEAENSYSEDSDSYLESKKEKFKTISKINRANRKNR